MRKFVIVLVASVFALLPLSPKASASSLFYDFSVSGTVESAVEVPYGAPGGPRTITSMAGQSFNASLEWTQTNAGTTAAAVLTTDFPRSVVIPVYPLDTPGVFVQTASGVTIYGDGSLASSTNEFTGLIGASAFGLGPQLLFDYANGSGTLTANIFVKSIDHADDQGFLTLTLEAHTVSPVPLPPTLPMFASALLALGIVAVYARWRQAHKPILIPAAP
jgi:hypothetical protein